MCNFIFILFQNGEGSIEIPLVYADALMDRNGAAQDELSFSVSNVIAVLDMTEDDWWQGIVEDRIGWFPASWVRVSMLFTVEHTRTYTSYKLNISIYFFLNVVAYWS